MALDGDDINKSVSSIQGFENQPSIPLYDKEAEKVDLTGKVNIAPNANPAEVLKFNTKL